VLRPSGALLRRDAATLNHDLSTAETIPCGTAGSVLRHLAARADPSDRHESRLHKLGIKVKIAATGGRLRNGAARISDCEFSMFEDLRFLRARALGER
jgi:hypothetical protein